MFTSGFWTVSHFAGAPVRVHWSVILLMLYFGGWQPGAWLGVMIIVVVHELGHALIVRAVGAQVTEVMVYGFGGYCGWRGTVTPRERALIAWGGVAAQAVLYLVARIVGQTIGAADPFTYVLLDTLTRSNLVLIAINLLPVPPLDGASAWPLISMLYNDLRRGVRGRESSPPAPPPPPAPDGPTSTPERQEASSRVTDPKEADRVFQRVYDDLLDAPADPAPSDRPPTDRDKTGST